MTPAVQLLREKYLEQLLNSKAMCQTHTGFIYFNFCHCLHSNIILTFIQVTCT